MTTLEDQRDELARLSQLYYEGTPEVSDKEFDALQARYLEAGGEEETGHGYIPTRRKQAHSKPMESLKKVKDDLPMLLSWMRGVRDYYEENGDKSQPLTFSVSPKFDGLAMAVEVKDSKVVRATTRGDGKVGEDVLTTARNVPSIAALGQAGDGLYMGEVMLPQENLSLANARRDSGDEPLKQLRNAAAGIIRKLNDEKKMAETLVFADHNSGSYVTFYSFEELAEGIEEVVAEFEPLRTAYPISEDEHVSIDGVVFKVENADVRDGLGSSSGSPRWARAYKFSDAIYESRVTGAAWGSPGKIGRITPVITYEPILIDGGTYTQASSHNIVIFRQKDAHVGDRLTMKKSGEVIPYIVSIEAGEPRGEKIEEIKNCPSCSTDLVMNGKYLICPAPREECDPALGLSVVFKALDIKGFGEGIIRKVYEACALESGDLFTMLDAIRTSPQGQIAQAEGLGENTEASIKKALNEAWTQTPLWRWIYALNALRVGKSVSAALVDTYGSLEGIVGAIDSSAAYKPVPLLTGVNWEHVVKARERFVRLGEWMQEAGVVPLSEQTGEKVEDEFWGGKKVALTGSLGIPRSEAEAWLKTHGAIPQKSLSSTTDILVDAGDGSSVKSKKAQAAGTHVMRREEFLAQMG